MRCTVVVSRLYYYWRLMYGMSDVVDEMWGVLAGDLSDAVWWNQRSTTFSRRSTRSRRQKTRCLQGTNKLINNVIIIILTIINQYNKPNKTRITRDNTLMWLFCKFSRVLNNFQTMSVGYDIVLRNSYLVNDTVTASTALAASSSQNWLQSAVMTYKIQRSSTPSYLSRHIKLCQSTRSLRSSDVPLLDKPTIRTELAKRSFRYAAPSVWLSIVTLLLLSNVMKFDANIFISDRNMAILLLCWFGCEMPLLFLSIRFWLQHHSASAFSPTYIFLDDC